MDDKKTGLIGGIQKFSVEDGPGIRTTVFLKGCPLNCAWCHNPELINRHSQVMFNPNRCLTCFECVKICKTGAIANIDNRLTVNRSLCDNCLNCAKVCFSCAMSVTGREITIGEVMRIVLQDREYYEHTGGGLTISGGELLTQADFASSLLDAAISAGINVAIDTSGCGSFEHLQRMAGKCDHILYDLKLIDPEKHKKYTGADNKQILSALEIFAADSAVNRKILVRMPLIHDVNDTPDIIERTLDFLLVNNLRKVTLLPYHELGVPKRRNLGLDVTVFSPPSDERLNEIKKLYEADGIQTEILGQPAG